jgi:hypothetical protein
MTHICAGCGRNNLKSIAGQYEIKPVRAWGGVMICILCKQNGIPPYSQIELRPELKGVEIHYRDDGSIQVPD